MEESMKIEGKIATWLDMVAPNWGNTPPTFRLHPIENAHPQDGACHEACYALSVDGRWVCSTNGRLTVLKGLETAEHFRQLINHGPYIPGEPTQFVIDCGNTAHCITMGRDQTLHACQHAPYSCDGQEHPEQRDAR
jgi:hypothetical protein